MGDQSAPPRPRRRGQKQKRLRAQTPMTEHAATGSRRGQKQKRPGAPTPKRSAKGTHAEALKQIGRLNLAKRRVRLFNKFALCVAGACMGRNIIAFVSNRRRGGVNRGSQRRFGRLWPLRGGGGSSHTVPRELLQPFGSYPNLLNITEAMRQEFHPVVKLPLRKGAGGEVLGGSESRRRGFWPWQRQNDKGHAGSDLRRGFWPWRRRNEKGCADSDASCLRPALGMNEKYNYILKDYTGAGGSDNRVLMENGERVPQLLSNRDTALKYAGVPKKSKEFDVGRYDEDRRGGMMYTSSLFLEGESDETNRRTVHIGLDIGAPVGTTVYAFEEGSVHSVGYNPDIGDYGHVMVIEHHLKNHGTESSVYALYGHLGAKSIQGKYPGQKIKKGQAIGYLGNTADNGGWTGSHVHFQLALNPPPTHDMPGVVSLDQRVDALLEYVDPRYVLGELY